jgi:hypothetical protein
MRKELLWAGIIGISFGLIIGFGTWRVKTSMRPKANSTPIPTPQSVGKFKITLDKPEDGDVVTGTPITVTGITKPLVWLTFSGENGDYVTESGNDGVFSQAVDLASGVNQINITDLDSSGNQISQKVLVVYSASFQEATPSAAPVSSSGTTSADINQEVAEKVALASNQPKAYIGTVTDIADSTIQIKTTDSQIEQIAIGGTGITVVNTQGTTNKNLKLTDIAIGDFIVAMGYVNEKSVLSAQRILVTDPVTPKSISVSLSKAIDSTKKILDVTGVKDGQKVTITPDKNTGVESFVSGKTKAIKLTDIKSNDLIITIEDTTVNPPLIRSIFDLEQPQS